MPIKVIKDIALDLGNCAFLEPYIMRELGVTDDDEPQQPAAAVRVVVDDDEGSDSSEMDKYCDERSLPLAVIRCPYIVGTGMIGLMRRMAAGIYNGRFVHIKGNEARISVIHATDVARAIALAAGIQGTYTLTDTTDPTIHDLAEALAYRLGDRRIITIKPKWARLWYGRSYYDLLTTDHTAVSANVEDTGCNVDSTGYKPVLPVTFTEVFPDFHPVEVTNYLRTHVYDDKSL